MSEAPSAAADVAVDGARLFPFEEHAWVSQNADVRGKRIVQGDGTFYLQYVEMQPGYRVTPHHHSMDELIVILEGGCEFGDERTPLGPRDSAVLKAGHDYGFDVGGDGMSFIIVRNGPATNSRHPAEETSGDQERTQG